MDVWSIGFLAGVMFGAIFLGIGVVAGRVSKDDDRDNQGQSDNNSDVRLYVPCRDRDRCSRDGQNQQLATNTEEIVSVLQTIRMGLSRTEKEALDYAVECVVLRNQLLSHINEIRTRSEDDGK